MVDWRPLTVPLDPHSSPSAGPAASNVLLPWSARPTNPTTTIQTVVKAQVASVPKVKSELFYTDQKKLRAHDCYALAQPNPGQQSQKFEE
jgi:hypothetical protein